MKSKYPLAEQFMHEHPEMTIDEAIEFLNNKIQQGVRQDGKEI